MKKWAWLFLLLTVSVPAQASEKILIRFKRNVPQSERNRALQNASAQSTSPRRENLNALGMRSFSSREPVEKAEINGLSVEEAQRRLRLDPNVDIAEPDYVIHAAQIPNDTDFSKLWALHNTGQTVNGSAGTSGADISAPTAWDLQTGNGSVIVAVIDSGIQYNHPDIAANMWINPAETAGNNQDDDHDGTVDDVYGKNFITGSGNPMDDFFHGTHVAGIIGAVGNNNVGVTGVNWNVKLMALKVLNSSGTGSLSDLIDAIDYAMSHGANIINISIADPTLSQLLHDEIIAATNQGIVVIAAAGNAGSTTTYYPAGFPEVIAVAGTDMNDSPLSFSNRGSYVALSAPGKNIWSTNNSSGYMFADGTSMSCAYVSGVAALLKKADPTLTPAQIASTLKTTVDVPTGWNASLYGTGRLNARRALEAVSDLVPPTISITNPLSGATVAQQITMSATAADNRAVSKVEFYVGATLKLTVTNAPYIYPWDTTSSANGLVTLTAKAYDTSNNTTQTSVDVTVDNDLTPPTVAITSPSDGAVLTDTVTLRANASDDHGVTRVEFYVDNVLIGTDATAPYSQDWNTLLVPNANHQLMVKAFDAVGRMSTHSVSVSVLNTISSLPIPPVLQPPTDPPSNQPPPPPPLDGTVPTVRITSPSHQALVIGSVRTTVQATDNVAVARVEFFVDGQMVGSETTTPYVYNWETQGAPFGTHHLMAKAYDTSGNSATDSVDVVLTPPENEVGLFVNVFNPAKGETISIPCNLAQPSHVRAEIFDRLGEKIITLTDSDLPAGSTLLPWNGRNSSGETVVSGIYFVRITTEGKGQTLKIVVRK